MALPPILIEMRANATEFMAKMGEARHEMAKLKTEGAAHSAAFRAGVGAAMLGAAGVAVEVGKKIVEEAMAGQEAQARLATAVRNTGGNMEEVEPIVHRLVGQYARLGFSSHDVEGAFANMTTAFGNTEQAQKAIGLAADLARYKHIDLADAATVTARALEGQLRPLKMLGIDLPVTAGGAAKLEKATTTLHAAQEKLRDILKEFPDAANAASDGHAKYEKALDKVRAAQDNVNHLSTVGQTIFTELGKRIGGQAAAQAATFQGKMDALGASMTNAATTIGMKLLPTMTSLAGFVTKHTTLVIALAGVIGGALALAYTVWIGRMVLTGIQTAIFAARVVIANVAMGVQIGLMYASAAASAAWTAAQWLLNASLLGLPLVWVVAAIAALVAAIIYAYKHFSWFREGVQAVWSALRTGVKAVVDFFVAAWTAGVRFFGQVVEWIRGHVRLVIGILFLLAPPVVLAIAAIKFLWDNWRTVWAGIQAVTSAVWGVLKTIFGALVSAGLWYVKTEIGILRSVWSAAWDAISGVVQAVWSVIGPIINRIVDGVGKVIGAVGKIAGAAKGLAKGAGNALSDVGKSLGFADGTDSAPGGLAMVGERGPELMYVPRGAQVIPNHRLAGLGGGESTVHVDVHVDGEVVARAVQRANKRYAVRNGRGLFATA